MPNYLRNSDDSVSDPDVIAAKYRLQKSAILELQIAEASLSSNIESSSSGGNASGSVLTTIVSGYSPIRIRQNPDEDPEF